MAAATPAVQVLAKAGTPYTLHEYAHGDAGPGFGVQAAVALGVDPARLFKTLVVDAAGRLAVAVVPVAGMLDLKAMGAALNVKTVRMAEPEAAERATGYVVGGISPLGQRKRFVTVIDETANGWPTIYVSAGKRGLQVQLSPADLVALTGATLATIGRST